MNQEAASASAGSAWLQFLQSIHDMQQQAARQYQQLWNDYVQTVQSARSDARSDLTSAAQTYIQDLNAALSSTDEQTAAVNAYQRYISAMQELQTASEREAVNAFSSPSSARPADASRSAWLDPDRTRAITEAWTAYNEAATKWNAAVQQRLTEANRKYMAAVSETTQDDAASTARAAYEKYVEGVYGTYKSSMEEVQESANEAADKVQSAARKRSK